MTDDTVLRIRKGPELTVIHRFASGPFAGSVRSIDTFRDSARVFSEKYVYNEVGHLERLFRNGKTTSFVYDTNGRIIRQLDDGSVTCIRAFDGAGNMLQERFPDGTVIQYIYTANTIEKRFATGVGDPGVGVAWESRDVEGSRQWGGDQRTLISAALDSFIVNYSGFSKGTQQ